MSDLSALCTVHQALLEIVRAHPDDADAALLLEEAEKQRDEAWEALRGSASGAESP